MAAFKFDSSADKIALRKRAESLKPKTIGVIATPAGWAKPQPNGTLELLVSFKGLDELLGDNEPQDLVEEPIVLVIPELETEPVVEEPVVQEEPAKEETPKAKPGRKPKVV